MDKKATTSKINGRVYTPSFIVNNILNMAGYYGDNVISKHVIDNSCGDGAFLTEIVDRYCTACKAHSYSDSIIAEHLGRYIHGIEIDNDECKKCILNVNAVASKHGVENVKWDIKCGNTIYIHEYDRKMDFVLGNPPYIRVHNLGDSFADIKKFKFAQEGMTDLYIVFFEIGLNMLSEDGVLGYITPSSYFNSVAGNYMRHHLVENNLMEKVIDFKHFQAFDATTYTTITILSKNKDKDTIEYFNFDEKNLIPYFVEELSKYDYYIANKFYFGNKSDLNLLKRVLNNIGKSDVEVKNGYATLADGVFIGDFKAQSRYILPIIKASKGITTKMIYPYDKHGKIVSEDELKNDKEIYDYLLKNKKVLLERSIEKNGKWFAFGRSQGVNDTYSNKLALNTLLRTKDDIKLTFAPSGVGVYSGLYITGDEYSLSIVKGTLISDEFATYIALLGKYKSGGYYTFSSKDVKTYLDYKLSYFGGNYNDD